jgi:S-adenosylmethionine hydrolase
VTGPQIDPATLRRLDTILPQWRDQHLEARIAHIDRYGNLITTISLSLVPQLFQVPSARLQFPAQGYLISERRRFFSDASAQGEEEDASPFIYADSSGYVAVAVRNGNAARLLHIEPDARDIVVILLLE